MASLTVRVRGEYYQTYLDLIPPPVRLRSPQTACMACGRSGQVCFFGHRVLGVHGFIGQIFGGLGFGNHCRKCPEF